MDNPTGTILRATRDNVWQAAEALLAAGLNPSVLRVRDWLGGGSNSSIGQYLRQWREQQAESGTQPIQAPDVLHASLNALYQQMEQERDQAIAAMRSSFEAEKETLSDALHQAQETVTQLNKELTDTQGQLQQQQQQGIALQQALTARERECSTQQARLEAKDEALDKAHAAVARQEKQVEHLFAQQMAYQERMNQERRQEAEQWEQLIWQQQTQLQQLQEEKLQQTEQRLQLEQGYHGLSASHAALQQQMTEVSDALASAENQLADASSREQVLTRQCDAQQHQLDTLQHTADSLRSENRLQRQLERWEGRLQQVGHREQDHLEQILGQLQALHRHLVQQPDNDDRESK